MERSPGSQITNLGFNDYERMRPNSNRGWNLESIILAHHEIRARQDGGNFGVGN